MRVPGADANPYLAMAASLASGLYGIKHQLPLKLEATKGNEYETSHQRLPTDLAAATQAMKQSDIANELFGDTFTDHFIRTREWEWQQYERQVGGWELGRILRWCKLFHFIMPNLINPTRARKSDEAYFDVDMVS